MLTLSFGAQSITEPQPKRAFDMSKYAPDVWNKANMYTSSRALRVLCEA